MAQFVYVCGCGRGSGDGKKMRMKKEERYDYRIETEISAGITEASVVSTLATAQVGTNLRIADQHRPRN